MSHSGAPFPVATHAHSTVASRHYEQQYFPIGKAGEANRIRCINLVSERGWVGYQGRFLGHGQ